MKTKIGKSVFIPHLAPRTSHLAHSKCVRCVFYRLNFSMKRKWIDMLLLQYFAARMSTTTADTAAKHEKVFVVFRLCRKILQKNTKIEE